MSKNNKRGRVKRIKNGFMVFDEMKQTDKLLKEFLSEILGDDWCPADSKNSDNDEGENTTEENSDSAPDCMQKQVELVAEFVSDILATTYSIAKERIADDELARFAARFVVTELASGGYGG